MPLLELSHISKTYRRSRAFSRLVASGGSSADVLDALVDIDLAMERGGAVGVVGESGAGKTTLAKMITGLEEPTTGNILVNGAVWSSIRDRKQRARIIQLVWQDAVGSIDPRMKIETALLEPFMIQGGKGRGGARTRVRELFEEVGLKEELLDRYAGELSGGQAQRVVIARALALNPDLLICDEPASALDAIVKTQIAELLNRLRHDRGMAILVIAHDLPLVSRTTDDLVVMYQGRIVESGPTAQILEKPRHPYTAQLINSDPSFGGTIVVDSGKTGQ